jgi:hypothetical protein
MHSPVPSLLKRWQHLETAMDLSAETFDALSMRFRKKTRRWLAAEQNAQLNRHEDSALMDIYDTTKLKGMDIAHISPVTY